MYDSFSFVSELDSIVYAFSLDFLEMQTPSSMKIS